MESAARFFARGNAVAAGGYVHRVNEKVIRQNIPFRNIASSLPVVGGSSESHTGPFRFHHEEFWPESVLSFASSFTKAWHTQDDFAKPEEQRVHTTHVMAGIERVTVGKRLSIERANAYLRSEYHHGEGAEISIKPLQAEITGLVLDDVRFKIALDTYTFATLDTERKVRDEYAKPRFVKEHGSQFLPGPAAPGKGQVPEIGGFILVTLVKGIEWKGKLPRGAKVEGHMITWPDFGKIFLGELLISGDARRLTLVRLELGSPLEAAMAFVDTESDGVGAP